MRIEDILNAHGLNKTFHSKDNQPTEKTEPLNPVYGIKIDKNEKYPARALTYIDDAENLTPARMNFSTDTFSYGSWENRFPFNQIKPCLYRNGTIVDYLNPNDYSKKVDGTTADITSGNDGSVMIEFPKIYWKFEDTDDYLYVRYSNTKIDEGYKCLAHQRGSEEREKIYIGAYSGSDSNNKLRSLSGKNPLVSKTLPEFRSYAKNNGANYEQMTYYQLLMLQVLYIVMFKDRDSQSALGQGYVNKYNKEPLKTGHCDNKGMFYGENLGYENVKFCGIEDIWGNIYCFLEGIYTTADNQFVLTNTNFNDTGDGYSTAISYTYSSNASGFIGQVQGGTESGFLVKEKGGDLISFYPDYPSLNPSKIPSHGGDYSYNTSAGMFCTLFSSTPKTYSTSIGARLSYY